VIVDRPLDDIPTSFTFPVAGKRIAPDLRDAGGVHTDHTQPGVKVEQTRAFYKRVADDIQNKLGDDRQDVFFNLSEMTKENWSFGNGESQYAGFRLTVVRTDCTVRACLAPAWQSGFNRCSRGPDRRWAANRGRSLSVSFTSLHLAVPTQAPDPKKSK
jgi:phenylpyruvate tautomerase PptA (4-oxalocrotonate tautomerase family)